MSGRTVQTKFCKLSVLCVVLGVMLQPRVVQAVKIYRVNNINDGIWSFYAFGDGINSTQTFGIPSTLSNSTWGIDAFAGAAGDGDILEVGGGFSDPDRVRLSFSLTHDLPQYVQNSVGGFGLVIAGRPQTERPVTNTSLRGSPHFFDPQLQMNPDHDTMTVSATAKSFGLHRDIRSYVFTALNVHSFSPQKKAGGGTLLGDDCCTEPQFESGKARWGNVAWSTGFMSSTDEIESFNLAFSIKGLVATDVSSVTLRSDGLDGNVLVDVETSVLNIDGANIIVGNGTTLIDDNVVELLGSGQAYLVVTTTDNDVIGGKLNVVPEPDGIVLIFIGVLCVFSTLRSKRDYQKLSRF